MSIRVHVDVVSAEELIFSGQTDFAVFPGEAGELYGGSSGFLVRLFPFLMIWGGLSLGMVCRFGTNPLMFLGFAMLTAVLFWYPVIA